MPSTPSHRLTAVTGLVNTLAAITVAGGYNTNLNGTGVVAKAFDTVQAQRESGLPVSVRVWDSDEMVVRELLGGQTTYEATLTLKVSIACAKTSTDSMVDTLNYVLRDVRLAVDKNPTLGAMLRDAHVSNVDEPTYEFDGEFAYVAATVTTVYYYVQGVEA
jgi:hypothetical protein